MESVPEMTPTTCAPSEPRQSPGVSMNRIVPILLLGILIGCTRSTKMEAVFSDLSIGVPEYQSIQSFTHPADAVKGDYFSLDFTQSSAQFHRFISKVSVAEGAVLSPLGASHVSEPQRPALSTPGFSQSEP